MDWSNENYVRVYVRNTTTWKLLGFEGQTVLLHVMRRLDRAGVMDLAGLPPWEAAQLHCELPEAIARIGMSRLLDRNVFVHNGDCLVMPNFELAQTAVKSNALKCRESRARRRYESMAPTDPNRPRDTKDVATDTGYVATDTGSVASDTERHRATPSDTLNSALLCSTLAVAEEAAAAAHVIPMDPARDARRASAVRGFRWWQDVAGLEPWPMLGKWQEHYAALGAMPASELALAASVLRVAGQRPGGYRTRILRPDHVVNYWPLYGKGAEPGQRVELPSQETPGAARIRATRERHAAEVLGRRAGSPEGLSYDLDIMRARHEMELSGTIAAVERDGNMRGGSPSRIRYG